MSWIHEQDLVDLYVFAAENAAVRGPVNATAPSPVTMRDFATALGRALHRPSFAKVPPAALELALGEMATVVLDGQRVVPTKALALGFTFRFTDVLAALKDVVGD
jgi:NAD dependent epimerase/dehydratase family enzyme